MTETFPKYLRDLNNGTVVNVNRQYGPNKEHGTTDSLYMVTVNLGNMVAYAYTSVEYAIGDEINLTEQGPFDVRMREEIRFNNLFPLLSKFGSFSMKSDEERQAESMHSVLGPILSPSWKYTLKQDVPIVIETYIHAITEAMRYCVDVYSNHGKIVLVESPDTHPSAPKNLYDLGVLHAQLELELERGEAIKSGAIVVKNQEMGRENSKATRAKIKTDVEALILEIVASSETIQNLLKHNYTKAAHEIIKLRTEGYLPNERTLAENYLPKIYPKEK